jgi:5-deoxy-glucuronate isomerase
MKFKISPTAGHQSLFQPGDQGIHWLGLEVLRLEKGESWQESYQDQEAALVILSGRCTVSMEISPSSAGDQKSAQQNFEWRGIGSRGDVFSGLPTTIYAPRGSKITLCAESKVEIAIGKAPATLDLPPVVVRPEDVKANSAGIANWRRDVHLMVPPGSPISQRLIVGETVNPPGNWSGFPPHKHDGKQPGENLLEEFYLYKARPSDGFGLQPLYCNGAGEVHIVGNDDVMVMLNGYHPTVATPGTTLYYLWILAGDSKAYDITIDPTFRWLSNAEPVIREIQR